MPSALLTLLNRIALGMLCLLLVPGFYASAQAPVKQWDRTLGGAGDDRGTHIQQTTDGGYIIGGTSTSGASGDKTQPNSSTIGNNYWVVKLDSTGAKQWDRTVGSALGDNLTAVIQTADGGYALGGTSSGNVSGDKSQPSRGIDDYWIVKLDAQGTKLWDRTFGGLNGDALTQLQQTPDGGYVLGGYSYSSISGDKTQNNRGPQYSADFWIVKIDATGTKQWDRTIGGNQDDRLTSICQTTDGGYIVCGESWSDVSGEKTQNRRGMAVNDCWVVKLDANGLFRWDKDFGTNGSDYFGDVIQTADGGYMLGGSTTWPFADGDKTDPGKGGMDAWLIKLAPDGTKQWDRTVGGNNDEGVNGLHQTADGGYVFASYSFSDISGDRTQPRRGSEDYWIIKVDASGMRQWDQAAGSSMRNELYSMRPTTRNGFVLCGYSNGGISLDKTQPSRGGNDFWVVKLGPPVAPKVAIAGDSVLCAGGSARLTATPPALTYAWNTGATAPSISVSQPGTYSVQATYANGVRSTASFQVQLVPAVPAFSLGADTTLCEGTVFVLRAPTLAIPGLTYAWSDGSTASTLSVREPGLYSLQITGCNTRTASQRVAYRSCLVIPNIITPNNDQANDQFRIVGLTGEWALQVYSRWGRQVFNTAAYRNDWGHEAAPGIYYYYLHQDSTGIAYKGWLEVAN